MSLQKSSSIFSLTHSRELHILALKTWRRCSARHWWWENAQSVDEKVIAHNCRSGVRQKINLIAAVRIKICGTFQGLMIEPFLDLVSSGRNGALILRPKKRHGQKNFITSSMTQSRTHQWDQPNCAPSAPRIKKKKWKKLSFFFEPPIQKSQGLTEPSFQVDCSNKKLILPQ